jgi:signal transduction histidine kinase
MTPSEQAGTHLLAVLQEALSNVARHAHATSVSVDVRAADWLTLVVTDDGVGLPGSRSAAGNGLRNLELRAATLGGTTTLTPAQPSGTVLCWEVPLT